MGDNSANSSVREYQLCINCGSRVMSSYRQCPNCGYNFDNGSDIRQSPTRSPEEISPDQSAGHSSRRTRILFVALFLLIAIVFVYRLSGLACRNGHTWKGDNSTGVIQCTICHRKMTADDIRAKHGENLEWAEEAFIYWCLDYYLTATDYNGKYLYSEDVAFSKVQSLFGVSRQFLNTHIWNGHAWNQYNMYYR